MKTQKPTKRELNYADKSIKINIEQQTYCYNRLIKNYETDLPVKLKVDALNSLIEFRKTLDRVYIIKNSEIKIRKKFLNKIRQQTALNFRNMSPEEILFFDFGMELYEKAQRLHGIKSKIHKVFDNLRKSINQ